GAGERLEVTEPRPTFPPLALLAIATGLGPVTATLATWLAASIPVPEARLFAAGDEVRADLEGAAEPARVVAFLDARGDRLPASPDILLEEPDVLPTFEE